MNEIACIYLQFNTKQLYFSSNEIYLKLIEKYETEISSCFIEAEM